MRYAAAAILFSVALASPAGGPALRLPGTAVPRAYDLHLEIDAEKPDYHGTVAIELDLLQAQDTIWLHALDLSVSEGAFAWGEESVPVSASAAEGGFLRVALPRTVGPGRGKLTLAFAGTIDDVRSRGIYRVREPDGKFYAYTFFEPIDARRAFPCFDEPSYKVPWTVTITVTEGQIAVGNAPLASERGVPGGREFAFAATPPLPSYLVAFVVGPFEIVEAGTAGKMNVPLRFVLPRGRAAELRYARTVTAATVGHIEELLGVPYPFAKLDVAVVPRFWGTMEHPGIVAMGQPLTLMRPEEESIERKKRYANILAHELGHFWFGDLVTMAWWDDTWLNEGVTTWVDRKVTDRIDPAWKFDRERDARRESAMRADGLPGTKALRQPIRTPLDIEASFNGATTYDKGDALLSMFEGWLGPETVVRALRAFLTQHAWKNATSDDLLAALSVAAGRDVGPVWRSFVEQPGVPVVELGTFSETRVSGTGSGEGATRVGVRLKQHRYSPLGASPAPDRAIWAIPVCIRYGTEGSVARQCGILDKEEAVWTLDAPAPPGGLIGNADGAGYYRVASATGTEAGTPTNASELASSLNDLGAEALAGRVRLDRALTRAAASVDDPDTRVVIAVLDLFENLGPGKIPDRLLPAYRRMVAKRFGPRALALGFEARAGEPVEDHELRLRFLRTVLTAEADAPLAAEAERRVRVWLDGGPPPNEDVKGLALMAAAGAGGRALFEAYLGHARRTTDRSERTWLLGSLGAFRDPKLLDRALALTLSGEFDFRDAAGVLWTAIGRHENRPRGMAFLKSHWSEIAGRMRSDEASRLVQAAATVCDQPARRAAAEFFEPRAAAIDGGPAALREALDASDACIAVRARNAEGVASFLGAYR